MKLPQIQLRRTTMLSFGFAALLIGLALARRITGGPEIVAASCVYCLLFTIRHHKFTAVGYIALLLGMGLWRGSVFMQKTNTYNRLSKIPVILQATADTDAVYAEKSQLSFDIKNVKIFDPINKKLVGKIAVKGFGEPMVYKGDHVQVEGKLYPTRGSRQASVSFATIKVLRRSPSRIDELRRRFASGMTSALPEPLGSFGLGLLIGQRTTLPKSLTEQLSAVGLTHIVAVSGYNLTIIIMAAHRLLQKRSKYQATVLTLSLIGLFLLLTGNSASIVRASIVSTLGLVAWYYGRSFKPTMLLLMAAAITAFWYPLYLWSDLGWWLSFLAFAGVLIVAPIVTKRFFSRRKPKVLLQVFTETFSAQVMTLPLIMYIFGKLSLVSIIANMAIVPLVPLAMLLSVAAGLAGMLFAPVAGWFAWPARVLMSYMIDLVQLLSKIPHALVQQKLLLTQMLVLYGLLILTIIICWKKTPKKSKITDRKRLEGAR